MSGISLQSSIIYGPILSRRLGRSLGINLMPVDMKACSFDCIYCQYGSTRLLTNYISSDRLPSVPEVISAVEKALKKPRTLDYVTFSGNGESTIHPDFPELVAAVRNVLVRLQSEAKLAVLSNGSGMINTDVIAALASLDAPIMKLDAGDEVTFRRINQPVSSVKFNEIIDGLKSIPNVMIQSMLIDGAISNVSGSAYDTWVQRLLEIKPGKVYIYSIDRPTADDRVRRVSEHKLKSIERNLRHNHGLNVEASW